MIAFTRKTSPTGSRSCTFFDSWQFVIHISATIKAKGHSKVRTITYINSWEICLLAISISEELSGAFTVMWNNRCRGWAVRWCRGGGGAPKNTVQEGTTQSNGVKLGKANSGSNIRKNLLVLPMTHETLLCVFCHLSYLMIENQTEGNEIPSSLQENQELKSYDYWWDSSTQTIALFVDVYSRKSGTTTFANPTYSSSLTLGWCAILAAGPSSGECCCHLQHHKTELSPGLLTSVLFVEPLTSLKICSPEHLDNTINFLHVFLISRYVKKCTKMFRDIHKIHCHDETGWISEIYTVRWVLGHTKPSFF